MIAANVAAARFLDRHHVPTLYRVHGLPEIDRLETLRQFLREFGLWLPPAEEITPQHLRDLLQKIGDRADAALILTAVIRSMTPRSRTFHGFDNLRDGRFTADCEKLRADVFFFQCVEQRTGTIGVPSGDDQRATTKSGGGGSNLCQRSAAEKYPPGGCEFKRHALLQPDSFTGKTVVYFVLLRGTAIMDSTVSRQRA